MGVEGGSIGSIGSVSAGLSVGGGLSELGAPGGEFGPGVGIGSAIVNEGPVAAAFLENTM